MLKVEEHKYMYGLSLSSLVSQSVNLFQKKKKLFRKKGSHHNDLMQGRKGKREVEGEG